MRYHSVMGQLLVRNVSEQAIAALKTRAAGNGRSMEAELREIVHGLVRSDHDAWLAELDRLREATRGRGGPSAVEILREDRESH